MIDREQLQRDGYTVLRDAIPHDWLDGLRAAFDACEPPYIAARKPFALNDEYVLRFNVETGRFSDSVSGWTEFGTCRKVNTFPQKLPS